MESSRVQAGTKIRKPRAARACELCRTKKNKCDELLPCTYCRNRNAECIYQNSDRLRRAGSTTDYVRQLEQQVRELSAQQALSRKPERESPGGLQSDFIGPFQLDSPGAGPPPDTPRALAMGSSNLKSQISEEKKAKEVTGVNRHTKNVEFYGSSSSMALLSRVRDMEHTTTLPQELEDDEGSLVSQLHNPVFVASPPEGQSQPEPPFEQSVPYHQQCRAFLSAFFSTIHFIHPILDKPLFLARCEDIWSGNSHTQSRSFIALYYSLLSLGALVGSRDEESANGMGNQEWSRKFFDKARLICTDLCTMTTDLEMVQCFFFMAKICQNELNPHLSYMYTGFAVRTSLAIGINREPLPESNKSFALLKAESRTWWGLYSLETEMSFAMGRPDTLGADQYHNRQFPQIQDDGPDSVQNPDMVEPRECAIIKCMVDFSRVTRTVCLGIYLSASPPQKNVSLACLIEQDLDNWLDNLPQYIRPSRTFEPSTTLRVIKEPQYVKKQRLVLSIRYHNVRMLLFASFLTTTSLTERSMELSYKENIAKCLNSATQTVEIIYDAYCHNDFFRTWYYNTTYTLFAVSILLVYIVQEATAAEKPTLYKHVEMSIEILETMDDCVVAKKAAKMIQRALSRAQGNSSATAENTNTVVDLPAQFLDTSIYDTSRTFNHYWGPLNLMDGEIDVSFPFELGDMDEGHSGYNDYSM